MRRFVAIASLATMLVLGACAMVNDGNSSRSNSKSLQTHPPTGKLIDVDGTTVHAHIEGSGPDLVLIHGAGGNTREFTFSLTKRLTDDFRVIVFDRPGHGYTDRIASREFLGETPQEQAALLSAAADQLDVTDAVVLGHSYGGAVAMAWALNHPAEIGGLVMLSAVANPWPGDLDQWYQTTNTWFGRNILIRVLSTFASRKRITETTEGIFEPDEIPEGYLDHVGVGLSKSTLTLQSTTQQVNGLKAQVTVMQPRYNNITIPVEIVHGTKDETVPIDVHARPLSKQLDNANLVELDGIGHMPHHADEDAVVAAIYRAAKRSGVR